MATSPGSTDRTHAELVFMAHAIQVARRYRSLLDEQLRSLRCGTSAMETMSVIARARHPLSQVEIANRMGIEGATLTRMLTLLENKRWVSRVPDPADGRAKQIALTEEGKKILRKVKRVGERFRHTLLDDLDETDLSTLNHAYQTVLKNLLQLS